MTSMPAHTSVFIERIAPNAAMLHPYPQEHAAHVCDLLTHLGWAASLVGPEKPVRGGILFFDGSEFDDAVLGDLADAVNSEADAGVVAYAYELAETVDEDGEPTLIFRRVGSIIPLVGNRVVLTHTYLFDDMATTWLFGASGDLAQACGAIDAGCANVSIAPVHSAMCPNVEAGPDSEAGLAIVDRTSMGEASHNGFDAVEIRHLCPTVNSDEAVDISREVVDALMLAGLSGPIILTDHREGADPDSSRLQADY